MSSAAGLADRRAAFLAAPDWRPGADARTGLSVVTDEWLTALYAEAGGPSSGAALVALGSHGRRELAPGSDLDLLLLHAPGRHIDGLADRLWYPVWDAGLRLDHSVRTMPEARRLAAEDLRVVLGILDARTIAGDDTLTAAMRSAVLADWRAMARNRLPELRASVEERAARRGDLSHLLEPDLKESAGGLRDIVVLRAVAASWLTDLPHAALEAPQRVLLDTRDALHHASGRPSDLLTAHEQPAVAAMTGHADADALLRAVSAAGRAVSYSAELTWSRVERVARPRSQARRLSGRSGAARAPLAEGVVAQDGEVVLALDAQPARDPVLLLRAPAAAAQAGLPLAPHTVERLAAECAPMPVPWPDEARDALVSLLGAGRATLRVWEAMDQADLWSRLIPEWSILRCAPQRNPVHLFTVDRHLVETAIRASALTRRVRRPDLLLVGALLHDVGKARTGDHTEVGIDLVAQIAPRMGFDEADSAVLVDLVRHHLLLPDVATRRDLDDPATAQAVARAIPDPGTLELLASLTEADSLATGPAVWGEWKASLIDLLVRRVRAVVGGDDRTPPRSSLTDEERALAAGTGLDVSLTADGPATRVTVVSPDRVGLLAATAGVLSLHRLGVRSARTETVGERVVAMWSVLPVFGDMPTAERLRDDLRRALEGSLDLNDLLARRDRDQPRAAAPPMVSVVTGASERSTVLEVRAHDAPGLLHRIAQTIAQCDVDVTAALVSTLGSEVVDVFYLRSLEGGPLSGEQAERVRAGVLDALDLAHEAGG